MAVRIDKWLWAVRLFKTRSAANDACSSGRVKIDGSTAKPAQRVKVDNIVTVRTRGVTRTYQVNRVIDKRVGAAIAIDCYQDQTPPETLAKVSNRNKGGRSGGFGPDRGDAAWAERERGAGRPTKRDRRQMDKFLGQNKQ